MPPYRRHVFICVNRRQEGNPKGCCASKGAEMVRAAFKDGLRARGIHRVVRANAAGCLDACATGPTVVVYPEGVWYGGVTVADVEEIIERHIVSGDVVERLVMKGTETAAKRFEPLGGRGGEGSAT